MLLIENSSGTFSRGGPDKIQSTVSANLQEVNDTKGDFARL